MSESFWTTIAAGAVGTVIGSIATIAAAMISRQPTLAAVVDSRIRVLIEAYERTIRELRAEIRTLEAKIDILSSEVKEANPPRRS